MLPQRLSGFCFKRVRFSSVLFFHSHQLSPRRPTPFQSMPCASSAAHSHVALPPRPLRLPSSCWRARRLTPLVSSCGAPTALRPWPLAPPPALLHHEPCHVCTSWLHSALRTTPRAVSSPFHGNTYRGTHIRARSPGGLTAWPGADPKPYNPGSGQSTHCDEYDTNSTGRCTHPNTRCPSSSR